MDWIVKAEKFILERTRQRTVLKAMNYIDSHVYSDKLFVEIVADAMKETYEETYKRLKKARTKKDEDKSESTE